MTPIPNIVGIGGTLHTDSKSLAALEIALKAASVRGAVTQLAALNTMNIPLYVPGWSVTQYGPDVPHLLNMIHNADGLIWATGAYHGTVPGSFKNALDFIEFTSASGYLDGKPVGLVVTAGGDMAAAQTLTTMTHAAHALRGTVVPLQVGIPVAWRVFDDNGALTDGKWRDRLAQMAAMLVRMAKSRQLERGDSVAQSG